MNLEKLENSGEIEPLKPSRLEITRLFRMAKRQLSDAKSKTISSESRLIHAYQAIFACATIALRINGYRAKSTAGKHITTINSMQYTLDIDQDLIRYLHTIRKKRHEEFYEGSLHIGEAELNEAISLASEILEKVKSLVA